MVFCERRQQGSEGSNRSLMVFHVVVIIPFPLFTLKQVHPITRIPQPVEFIL